jgi:hypothetical protein
MKEEFFTKGKTIAHHAPVGSFSSARGCLGATDGWVDISDGQKGISIFSDKAQLYSVPMVEYEEIKKTYLMRLYHSVSESDETGRVHWRGHNSIRFSFLGHNGHINNAKNAANRLSRPLICIPAKQYNDKQTIFEDHIFELADKTNYVISEA